jgi:hypothetical protein
MGIPIFPLYGKTDIGSAVEDIEKLVEKIKSNKFGKKDVIKLYEANAELIKAVLEDEIKD